MRTQALRKLVEEAGGLLTQADMARRYGASRRRVHSWARSADFPEPFVPVGSNSYVWLAREVDEWVARRHPEIPPDWSERG